MIGQAFFGTNTLPLWTPAKLTPEIWLDASDSTTITTASGGVNTWADKTANGNNFTQGSGTLNVHPTVTTAGLNGLNVINFSGTSFLLGTATHTRSLCQNVASFSTYIVSHVNVVSSGVGRLILWSLSAGTSPRASITLFSSQYLLQQDRLDSGTQANNGLSHVAGARITGAEHSFSTAQSTIWVDGTGNTSATGQGSGNSVNTISTEVELGGTASVGSQNIVGDVAEMVCISGLLSTTNRQILEGYFAYKWGLTANLPSGHPYKTVPPYA